jgi:hypothetical protein
MLRLFRSLLSARRASVEEVRVRAVFVPQEESVPVGKPSGGYQLIPVVQLALVWWCYREKLIRLADLRVWLAAWEMRARRCRRPDPLPRRFGLAELQGLTGLSVRRLEESLCRLTRVRLLSWSDSAVEFPVSAAAVPLPDRDAFARFLHRISNHGRLVPVPRRILRLLAGGARPALMATVLGHLMRCLYLKQGKCSGRGRVKASWIAETFGVGLRRVKEARGELIAIGWLIALEADQWALNRWGAHVRINLDWSRLDGIEDPPAAPENCPELVPREAKSTVELAPPVAKSTVELAPPESDQEPLQDDKNQKPATGGRAGVFNVHGEEKTAEAMAASLALPRTSVSQTGGVLAAKPELRNVVPQDLRDTGRLLDLYEQAVGQGMAAASEWGRLRFVAVAEHARVIGTKNPCGLFVRLVRGGLWHFATHDDEMAASIRLRRHLHGEMPERLSARDAAGRLERELSEDARLVRAVRETAARMRLRGDPFPLLKREKPEWTRARWDSAVTELEGK